MRKKRYIILVLAALLTTGCHTSRRAAAPQQPEASADTLPSVVAEPPHRTYTVVNFKAEVEGISVDGQLRMAEDSVMWLSVNKVFEVARALATPDSVFLRSTLLGRDEAMDYATLQRRTGFKTDFDEMQQIATADNAEQRIADLAQKLGFTATVHLADRRQVERLSFPYPKTRTP